MQALNNDDDYDDEAVHRQIEIMCLLADFLPVAGLFHLYLKFCFFISNGSPFILAFSVAHTYIVKDSKSTASLTKLKNQ